MLDELPGATPLDPDEMEGLKFRHVKTRQDLDELEQANIAEGLLWLSAKRQGDILTSEFIRKLHKQLFGGVWRWAGRYRLSEKNIGIDPFHIAPQLHSHLENARYWAQHAVFPPLEAAARFHHRLVQIHPFPNGNGRHARIAADIYLQTYFRHPSIIWATGVDLQADSLRRVAYLAALRAADANRFGLLLEFVGA